MNEVLFWVSIGSLSVLGLCCTIVLLCRPVEDGIVAWVERRHQRRRTERQWRLAERRLTDVLRRMK